MEEDEETEKKKKKKGRLGNSHGNLIESAEIRRGLRIG